MSVYAVIARLLEYPSQELLDHLPEVTQTLPTLAAVTDDEKQAILTFTHWLGAKPLLQRQEHYVNTFDMEQSHSLHITHHLYGESKERGPALANLVEFYRSHGFEMMDKELPDFLPVILEFISGLDEMGAKVFLADAGKALVILKDNLAQANNPYAGLMKLLEARGRLVGIAA